MFKDFDVNIIDKYLKEKFPIIFDFKFNGLTLLQGGTIRDLMMGKYDSKDLDFILLTQEEVNLNDFIKKHNVEILKENNRGYKCGYKLRYNGVIIDILITKDLYYAAHLSIDYLFYDIHSKQLIPIGIKRSIEKNIIYDYRYQDYRKAKKRIKKYQEFIMYLNHKKRPKVIYKYNRPYYFLLAILKQGKNYLKEVYNVKSD